MSEDHSADVTNPYEPPGQFGGAAPLAELGEPLARFEAENLNSKQRRSEVLVYPDRLRVRLRTAAEGGEERAETSGEPSAGTSTEVNAETYAEMFDVPRSEFGDRVRIVEGLVIRRCLEFKKPQPAERPDVILQFAAGDYDWLTRWMGPVTPEMLRATFRPRLRFALPLGILIAATSLPLPGFPLDPLPLALGLGLIALCVLTRLVPHRMLLLLDGAWFLLLAGSFAYDVLVAGRSYWWLIMVLLNLGMAGSALLLYRRLGKMQTGLQSVDPNSVDPPSAGDA